MEMSVKFPESEPLDLPWLHVLDVPHELVDVSLGELLHPKEEGDLRHLVPLLLLVLVLEVVSPPRVLLDVRDVLLVRVGAHIHVVNCVEPRSR